MPDGKTLIERVIEKQEYDFLRKDPHLGHNIMFLTFGGSLAYGTNLDQSDIDIRGVTANQSRELLGLSEFDQIVDQNTDTTIYGFMKFLNLLINCNPKAIEMLGCREEDYALISPSGKLLLDNKRLFLSQKAILTFGTYANLQLRKFQIENSEKEVVPEEKNDFIRATCEMAMPALESQYGIPHNFVQLKQCETKMETSSLCIRFNEQNLHESTEGVSIQGLTGYLEELLKIEKSYSSFGKRNKRAKNKSKKQLDKHVMHLLRQYLMVFDILEENTVKTYRDEDHDLLMSVRNGAFANQDGTYSENFFDMVSQLDKRLQYAIRNTTLPEAPDLQKIEELAVAINRLNIAFE